MIMPEKRQISLSTKQRIQLVPPQASQRTDISFSAQERSTEKTERAFHFLTSDDL